MLPSSIYIYLKLRIVQLSGGGGWRTVAFHSLLAYPNKLIWGWLVYSYLWGIMIRYRCLRIINTYKGKEKGWNSQSNAIWIDISLLLLYFSWLLLAFSPYLVFYSLCVLVHAKHPMKCYTYLLNFTTTTSISTCSTMPYRVAGVVYLKIVISPWKN